MITRAVVNAIIAGAFYSLSCSAQAMTLTFDASYTNKGSTSSGSESISPINFQFQVQFAPVVTDNQSESGTYTVTDSFGSSSEISYVRKHTIYGTPEFTSSPVSESVGRSLSTSSDPNVTNFSQASIIQSSSMTTPPQGDVSLFAGKEIFIEYDFESTPDAIDVYTMGVLLNLDNAPSGLNDVGFTSSSDLITYLESARDLGSMWVFYEYGGHENLQIGYSGTARLIEISEGNGNGNGGVSTVPIPAAAWLFGSTLLGFVSLSNRRKV